ncbi:glycosyltransferase family 2 protein [Roseinatronobacter sp. NSM]|uniref:glycosyltransferase family 2 protein n=1 Tax=Roseinatronobacter sp. NSM TaxID=3457785 RepID=UPI00403696EB
MQPTCSIVCTTYNHAKFASLSLASIFKQDYPNIEIVIVDDGSTDGNVDVIRETLKSSPFPYVLIAQDNTGNIPMNVNRGIAAATGDYISFLSLDDIIFEDAISSKMEIVKNRPDTVFVANTCNTEINDAGATTKVMFKSPLYEVDVPNVEFLLETEYEKIGTFYLQAVIIKADAIRAFGGMDEDISGDDLILRTKLFKYMIAHGTRNFALIHELALAYRKHDANLHKNVWNQIKTVADWHARYFPDRPFPGTGRSWVKMFVNRSLKAGDKHAIQKARDYSPVLADIIDQHLRSWKCKMRVFKNVVKSAFANVRNVGKTP